MTRAAAKCKTGRPRRCQEDDGEEVNIPNNSNIDEEASATKKQKKVISAPTGKTKIVKKLKAPSTANKCASE